MPLSAHARENYPFLIREIAAAGAQLVAVSKTQPDDKIMALYTLGQRDFGENRVPELAEKAARLPADIRWHFIGHLQRNKVKALLPHVHLIHSVDSERLLLEIDEVATRQSLRVGVLLQFHIAEEETKYGFSPAEARAALARLQQEGQGQGLRILGVMGMATNTEVDEQIAAEFMALADIFKQLKAEFFDHDTAFSEISMGMSGDFAIALERGSTLVRVGSLLFG